MVARKPTDVTAPKSANTSPNVSSNASAPADNRDLFLNEDQLVALAMQHLGGRLPPGFDPYALLREKTGGAPRTGARGGKPMDLPQNIYARQTLLARELEARGWTSGDLARAAGFAPSEAAALARGSTRMTRDVAKILAKLFATSEEFWTSGDTT